MRRKTGWVPRLALLHRKRLVYCTVKFEVPTIPSREAEIVVEPVATGLAKPALVMVATAVSLELHVTDSVTLPLVPSEYVAVAVYCSPLPPTLKVKFCGFTVMVVMVLVLTVSTATLEMTLPDLAVMLVVDIVVPAVASPEVLMVATPVLEEVHVTDDDTSPVELLP